MKTSAWLLPMGLSVALIGWTGVPRATAQGHNPGASASPAQPATAEPSGHSHARCELHGGTVTMTRNHHFETLYAPDGIRIFTYSADQAPQMAEKAKGRMTLKFKDGRTQELPMVAKKPLKGETTVYFCPMHKDLVQMEPGVCPKCGGMTLYVQDYLYGAVDLSQVEPGTLKAVIRIEGLAGPEADATFTETFQGWAPAAEEEQGGAPHESSQHDHAH